MPAAPRSCRRCCFFVILGVFFALTFSQSARAFFAWTRAAAVAFATLRAAAVRCFSASPIAAFAFLPFSAFVLFGAFLFGCFGRRAAILAFFSTRAADASRFLALVRFE
eukprot:TRINITY_DN964_c0_g1_i4.p2 TRINITY_DN964_c0_g1~~TRINITY_DN964_c0_g1_i4.p2  ORF type:complete len:109 (-),score=11.80 TRINITY_DN964_c0_g1_i4:161-487(-)